MGKIILLGIISSTKKYVVLLKTSRNFITSNIHLKTRNESLFSQAAQQANLSHAQVVITCCKLLWHR